VTETFDDLIAVQCQRSVYDHEGEEVIRLQKPDLEQGIHSVRRDAGARGRKIAVGSKDTLPKSRNRLRIKASGRRKERDEREGR